MTFQSDSCIFSVKGYGRSNSAVISSSPCQVNAMTVMNSDRKKILVIDDEEPVALCVKATLDHRYDVATTTGVNSAFKFLAEYKVDLILLDIKMPQMNGIDALRKIKRSYPDVIVIMLTAYASEANIRDAKMSGAYGFIKKPFEVLELRTYVGKVLD